MFQISFFFCVQLQMGKTVSLAAGGTQFAHIRPTVQEGRRDQVPYVEISDQYESVF